MINKTLRRLAVGAAAITVAGVVVPLTATAASAATNVSGVTAQPSPNTAGANPAQYNINFTTSASGALTAGTDTITVSLSGGQLPVGASNYVVNGVQATAGAGAAGSTETITTPVNVGNSSAVNVTISGATNPGTGTYHATVNTSQDATPANSTDYAIVAGATQPATFAINGNPSPNYAGAKGVYSFTLTTSASGALTAGTSTITLAGPSGTVFPLAASDYTVNGVASTVTPTQTAANNVTFTTPVSVAANGGTANIVAAGVTNPAVGNTYTISGSTSSDAAPKASGTYTIVAAPSQVTNVTGPNPTPNTTSTSSKYTIGFTPTTAVPGPVPGPAGTITLTAPAGTTFTATASNYTVNGVPAATATLGASNNIVTLTIGNTLGLPAGQAATVVANSVTNPATPSTSYTLQVQTSTDPGPVSTPAYSIVQAPGAVNFTSFTATPASAGATAVYNFGATTSPSGALAAGTGTITITAPSGTVFPTTPSSYVVGNGTDTVAATTVTGGGSNAVTITTPVSIGNSSAFTVQVNGVTNPAAGTANPATHAYQIALHTSSDTADQYQNDTITAASTNTAVTGLTFSPSSTATSATNVTDTVKFTTSASGALAAGTDTITLNNGSGQVFANTAADYTVNGQAASAISGAPGNTVTITSPINVGASSPVTVVASGVTNSATQSAYTFSANTNKDVTPASTAYAISGNTATFGAVSNLTINPAFAGKSANYSFTFTPSANGSVPAGGTVTVSGPTGTVFPSTASNYTVTSNGFSAAAGGTVTGGGTNSVTFTTPVGFSNGNPANITIAGVTNPAANPGGTPTYKLAVSTSSDTTPAQSAAYTITTVPTAVTGVSGPNPSPATPASNATYTVAFTTTTALVGGTDTITLSAPGTTVLPAGTGNYTVNNVAIPGGAGGGAAGNPVTITVPNNLAAGTPVTVKVINVTNPAAGSYTMAVSTSKDTAPVNTPSYTISAAATQLAAGITVGANPNTANAQSMYVLGSVKPTTALPAGGTITITAPAGTAFPLVASDYVVDGVASTVTPTQSAPNNVTFTSPIALSAGNNHTVDIVNVTNPNPSPNYTLSVATSTDTSPRTSNTYAIAVAGGSTPTPSVSSVSPGSGSFQGGTTVTIQGSNLGAPGTATVTFGSNPASIVSDNGSTIVVTSPAGTAGQTVPVTVTVGGQSSAASSGATFTYTTASSDYLPVTPTRILSDQAVSANTAVTFTLPSSVPAGTGAVAFNVTAVNPNTVGNLRVYPACGTSTTPPTISLVNYEPGHDTANFLVVSLQCPDGTLTNKVNFYSANSNVSVDVDLAGTYPSKTTGSSDAHATVTTVPGFTGVGPTRVESDQSIAANTSKKFTLSGIPSGAKAVALNVTSIHPNGNGNLRVYPGDQTTVPTTSNVNFIPGVDKAGFVIINLPADGSNTINIYSAGTASSVDVDLFGVFPAGSSTTGLTQPVRVLDTRAGSGKTQGLPDPLAIGTPYNVTVTGNGVPANASAVVVSLTAIHAAGSSGVGNLRAYPAGGTTPTVSNINYIGPKADVANLAIVRVGANGQITLVTNGSVIDAAVDVLGYVPAPSS